MLQNKSRAFKNHERWVRMNRTQELEIKPNKIKGITYMNKTIGSFDNIVFLMGYDRRILNSELVKNVLYRLTRGIELYKTYKHLNYPLIKRKKSNKKQEEKRE